MNNDKCLRSDCKCGCEERDDRGNLTGGCQFGPGTHCLAHATGCHVMCRYA